ncbi:MAG: hypothetical protein EBW30_07905 [Synechococcaceae bacterium WB7_3xG_012]|nr:hypothetical protein [Synechococcaceae bacterium WB7_3xG_012]
MPGRGDGGEHEGTEPESAVSVMKLPTLLDQQAIATLSAGGLLIAISFLTNYGHGAFFHFSALPLDEQIGVSLHTAALAALFGDAELASRLRDRARDRLVETRQREIRRLIATIRFELADTTSSRLQLNAALA